MASLPGSRITLTRGTMLNLHDSALAGQLNGSSGREPIPVLARYGLKQLIELDLTAVLTADRLSPPRSASVPTTAAGRAYLSLSWATSPVDSLATGFCIRVSPYQQSDHFCRDHSGLGHRCLHPPAWPQVSVPEAQGGRADARHWLRCWPLQFGGERHC
jgi:hypothetical protein